MKGGKGGRNSFRKRISPCRRIILLQRQRYYNIYMYYANATDRHTHTHIILCYRLYMRTIFFLV